MIPETPESIPVVVRPPVIVQPALSNTPDAGQPTPALTPEEQQALQAVFAQRPAESEPGAALVGLWSAGMLAHDLLADHLARSEEEEAEEERSKKDRPQAPDECA
jgi:hypothetical protein